MATNAIVDSIIFKGSLAGQTTIESQGIGGNLTFQLPNVPPIVGQLLTATALNNSTVVLGFASPNSSVSTADLDDVEGNGSKVQLTNGSAAPSPVTVQLAAAANYAILAAAGITNTGLTIVTGGVIGSNPTTTITFDGGTATVDNANAAAAHTAANAAYLFYSALTFTSLGTAVDLSVNGVAGSNRYIPGNYSSTSSMAMSTGIVLDAQGNANAIFVFKAVSTVNLASGQAVTLINGAQAANVVWLVGSSFTSVAPSTMVGTILADTSITLGGGPTFFGRALAGVVTVSGAVTIASANSITVPSSVGVIAAGDVVIYDAFGNVMSSGILLSSLGGAAGVTSFNGRSGAVSPLVGDYSAFYMPIGTQLPITKALVASNYFTSYSSVSGLFTAAPVNFTDLAGSIATGQIPASTITIAQINSKQGTGNAVQLTNTGATVNDDVVIYDGSGNLLDSGILLSSLASSASVALKANIASPTFTGTVTAPIISGVTALNGNGAAILTITETVAGVQISGSAVNRGVGVNTIYADGVILQDNTAANAVGVSAVAGGILLQTSGTGNVTVSASSVSGTNGNFAIGNNIHLTGNTDVRGTLTVTNPATSATFTFARAFASAPVVVVVPQSNPVGDFISYWVTSTTTDFTVNVNTTPATSAIFNYHVIG